MPSHVWMNTSAQVIIHSAGDYNNLVRCTTEFEEKEMFSGIDKCTGKCDR